MPKGYLSLVLELHHRLPAPGEGPGADWATAAVETYWPLLAVLSESTASAETAILTLAVSPAWTALAADPDGQAGARLGLDLRAEDRSRPEQERAHGLRQFAIDRWGGDMLAALRQLADSGAVELVPMTSSHAWLPSVAHHDVVARAQVALAARDHEAVFGTRAQGIWLPHQAYRPGLEQTIASRGLRCFGVDAEAFRRGTVQPPADVLGPLITRPGTAAFGIDPAVTAPLTDPATRYANDPRYQDASTARRAAREHGDHFVERWRGLAAERTTGGEAVISVAAASVHDLTRGWAGGIDWLARVLDRLLDSTAWRPTTLDRFLDRHPEGPLGRPGPSAGGWPAVKPGGSSDLIDRLDAAAALLADVVQRQGSLDQAGRKLVARMTRCLLRAQALDWTIPPGFEIRPEDGLRRAALLLDQFAELAALLASGRAASDREGRLERLPTYLPAIDLDDLGPG